MLGRTWPTCEHLPTPALNGELCLAQPAWSTHRRPGNSFLLPNPCRPVLPSPSAPFIYLCDCLHLLNLNSPSHTMKESGDKCSLGSESKPPSSHWPLRSTIIESSSHFSVALKIIRNSGINSICPVAEFFTGICLLLPHQDSSLERG